jgi:predicted phosphodiesterase
VRFLIVTDLHANWHALHAVLTAEKGKFEQIICCGDLVGYNPHPSQVLNWTRTHCASVIRGNHDKVVAGLSDLEWFNDAAQASAVWTIGKLDQEQLQYLRDLPAGPLQLEHFHICHGSPRDEDQYVTTTFEATPCFRHFELPLAFFGHTHLQGGFFYRHGAVGTIRQVPRTAQKVSFMIEPATSYMFNPGSVGQPRDGDPRAAYATFDSEQKVVSLHRVEYDVGKTANEILQAGLPGVLAFRLSNGL